jgi:hypothetical protein
MPLRRAVPVTRDRRTVIGRGAPALSGERVARTDCTRRRPGNPGGTMAELQAGAHAVRSPLDGYAPDHEHRPLGGYLALSTVFEAGFVGALVAAHRAGRPLPAEIGVKDIVLTGVATHKLARLIAKDKVTSFLRAPFTRYQQATGYGEVAEQARGKGLRLATGELLVCPYCLAQWIAGAFTIGHVAAPRLTRLLTAMWTAHALADAAQLAYSAAEKRV